MVESLSYHDGRVFPSSVSEKLLKNWKKIEFQQEDLLSSVFFCFFEIFEGDSFSEFRSVGIFCVVVISENVNHRIFMQ